MTENPTPDVHDILDDHGERIGSLERWRDSADGKMDGIRRELSAVRAEGQAQSAATSAAMDRQSRDIQDLTRQLAEHTGAQKERNRLDQAKLTKARIAESRWKKRAAIFGLVFAVFGALGGTLLSSQTWDDFFFANVPFLHHHHIIGTLQ
ncbi:hypothetical protein CFR73_07655 [Novacetimonas maltaceti]|uniref:Uncharacterized protein n=1 Tax=Novacetimonas maltaceti TaxID=1203393 RepID=A0A2S3W5Q3_9PROT|nr:hypothetical protein [Novacetimonas maltaceti]POF63863.1 hypothetical protein KMAL_03940 [Novacetimonas maltaceti]PYD60275.1 hypothetical protein CFR73_07655 [Novacetimonas maltaceti]BCZ75996.1 hypothetical protein [Komagataeibacter phage phiKM1]